MAMLQYLSILDKHVVRYGVPRLVSLQGEGEPTLNRSFFEMAAYVRNIGSEPYTITNGTYKYPERFADSFSTIGISIDTLDPSEAIRIGRPNLSRVIEFATAISSIVSVIIHSVALSRSVEGVAIWCRARGFRHVVQPLQRKSDYRYRYSNICGRPPAPKYYECAHLEQDLMRYYAIDGTELPCCYIKDTRRYPGMDGLRKQLHLREIPSSCAGCRNLT